MKLFELFKEAFFGQPTPDPSFVPSKYETELAEIASRNAERAERAKVLLGDKYLCHPKNQVKRIDSV